MRTVLTTLFASAIVAGLGGAAFVYSGAFNVAASDPHWPVTEWVLEKARVRSIQSHAAGLTPPLGYDEQERVIGAVTHFTEHCAVCHGGPGTAKGEIADGMYPEPPNLSNVAARYTPGELFWILKNGIKMSAMPGMASDGDPMLWSTVALLEKFRGMSTDDYNELWMAAQMQGEHGGMDHSAMHKDMAPTKPTE